MKCPRCGADTSVQVHAPTEECNGVHQKACPSSTCGAVMLKKSKYEQFEPGPWWQIQCSGQTDAGKRCPRHVTTNDKYVTKCSQHGGETAGRRFGAALFKIESEKEERRRQNRDQRRDAH